MQGRQKAWPHCERVGRIISYRQMGQQNFYAFVIAIKSLLLKHIGLGSPTLSCFFCLAIMDLVLFLRRFNPILLFFNLLEEVGLMLVGVKASASSDEIS